LIGLVGMRQVDWIGSENSSVVGLQ